MENGDRRPRLILLGLSLALITLAVYWRVTGHDFTNFDDQDYVTANQRVQAGLTTEGLRWAFRTGLGGNWMPLTWLSHMLDCQLFGLNAGRHHSTSLLLHVANTILLLLVLERMTRAIWRSALVAALFALHPLHVESVAWVAERKDVLSGFFFMLTLWAYARHAQKRAGGQANQGQSGNSVVRPSSRFSASYWLAFLWFALGLMSKPMLVTLPFLLLLLDYWPLRRFQLFTARNLLLEKLPFFALTLVTSVITMITRRPSRNPRSCVAR